MNARGPDRAWRRLAIAAPLSLVVHFVVLMLTRPDYRPVADVLARIDAVCREVEQDLGVKVAVSFEQKEEAAPPTPADAPVVGLLRGAVKAVYGVEGKAVGIGGGTVAANLRRKGLPCVVWSRMDETMHAPNENACISNILGDAKVLAHVLFAGK